jgi:RNA polymerase sigma factor (sigma-70 family)
MAAPLNVLRQVFDRVRSSAEGGDGELLTRYRTLRDQDAFGSIVRRHAPMVLGVCRRVLGDHSDADDAFQATFLVLARKADAVRPPDRLGPWLYGVAYRTALKARGRAYRRREVERAYAANAAAAAPAGGPDDLTPLIDEQLNALPEKYRTPLLLCTVQGLGKAEAAARLGLPEGTVSSRLARARDMLRERLARRGVVVPAAALGAVLTADTLQAAVPLSLVACAAGASGPAPAAAAVLTLSHEVIRSMALVKLKFLGAVALSVSLAGGFGLVATRADDRKPAPQGEKPATQKPRAEKPGTDKPKPEKPAAEKPRPERPAADKPRPEQPEGQKPRPERPATRGGKVAGVDAKENTITIAFKSDSGVVERLVKLAPGAKVFIDGKEAKLADVPKNSNAAFVAGRGREGELPEATELRISGSTLNGVVKEVGANAVTLAAEKADRTITLAPGATVTVDGKPVKLADLRAGARAQVTLTADEKAALTVTSGARGDRERPEGERPPAKRRQFGGRIESVDAAARTITLAAKGEAGKAMVVRVTDNAAITVDGKPAKLADLKPGAPVTFNLASARDGQPREVDEVAVAGSAFVGTIKQIDGSSLTIGSEKTDRVFKVSGVGKVMLGEKEGKLADLKVGDRVAVTLTADESAAAVITVVAKRRGEKEDNDEDQ